MSLPPTPPPFASQPLSYQSAEVSPLGPNDCSTRMMVIGIIYVIMGAMAGCGAMMMPFAMYVMKNVNVGKQAELPPNMTAIMIAGFALYAAMSGLLITLGIGSIRKRRWSHPFVIILSIHWLVCGIASILITPPMVYLQMQAQQSLQQSSSANGPPEIALWIGMGITILMGLLLGVVLPAFVLFAFKDPKVKETVEFYDPTPRWTDACPLRVLGLAVTLWVFAGFTLFGVVNGKMVFFGILMPQILSFFIILIIGAVMAISGWWIYKMKKIGYLTGGGLVCLMTVSMIISPLILDLGTYLKSMGMNEEIIHIYTEHTKLAKMGVFGLPILLSASLLFYFWQVWNAYRSEIN